MNGAERLTNHVLQTDQSCTLLLKTDQSCTLLKDSPVMHAAERLLVGDVIHEDEAHGAPVVSRGDGPVPLLSRCVLHHRIVYLYG